MRMLKIKYSYDVLRNAFCHGYKQRGFEEFLGEKQKTDQEIKDLFDRIILNKIEKNSDKEND
jgi:hypothetical protein